ncbi:hypothetical protein [Desulfonatronospira thiodismutans]|uniref:hypothetical protein n=1 Tax=Desulfonatronospira thiodismutans TaxID=488939 RepID=UPI0012946C06|nr:hypothetical protein [Desulfonatronospira thiodismutans]
MKSRNKTNKRRGAQPGNSNAKKHGWYSEEKSQERERILQARRVLEDLIRQM